MADMATDIADTTMTLYKAIFEMFFAAIKEFGHIAKALAKGTWNNGKSLIRWSRKSAAPAIKQYMNKDQELLQFDSIKNAVANYEALLKTEKFKEKDIELLGDCVIVNKRKFNKIGEAQLHKLRYEVTRDEEGFKKKVKDYEDKFTKFNKLMEDSQAKADKTLGKDDPNHDKSLKNPKIKDNDLIKERFDSVYEAVKFREELLAKTHVNTNEPIFKSEEVKIQGTTVIYPKKGQKVAAPTNQKIPEFDTKDK